MTLGKPQLRVVTAEEVRASLPRLRARVWKPLRGMDTYNSHPVTGLTAETLLGMYRQAEAGSPLRQFDAFDDFMEIGGHLRGLVEGEIEAVSGCDWVLQPGRRDKASEIAAAELEERLRAGVGFRDFLEHQLSAEYFGMAATNLVWDRVERVIQPIEFVNVSHRRFAAPSAERAGEIMLIGGDSLSERIELEPGYWAVTVYRSRNPWAGGKLRTAGWWEMFKRWSMRDWQVFAEMFGLPLVLGYYEEGASQTSREALTEAVKSVGEDGFAILSTTTELVVKETARSGDSSTVYPKIVEMCEQQQSKLIAGSTTATDTTGVGSYNLGTVHATRAYKSQRRRATRIDDMFTEQVGIPYIAWNGHDRAAPPRLKIQITRDSLERAQVVDKLAELIDVDEDQLREEFSLRVPAPGKGVRKAPKQAAPAVPPPES